MGPFVILGAKERKSTWGDKKKMVNQFTDFEIFEEEYYDFADFLALELSDQRRKDRDNKKLRMSRRYRVPNFFIKSSEKNQPWSGKTRSRKTNRKRIPQKSLLLAKTSSFSSTLTDKPEL